jgi:membrane peptidoglycan carboxypeptidase
MKRVLWSTRRRRVWLVLASLAAALAALLAAAWLTSPAGTELAARVQSRLRSSDGRAVPLSTVPRILREAVVATEDERFYQHHGIDLIGLIRALPYDLVHLSFAEGASTITEQVAKILYLQGNDHNPWRKLEDATVALKLEQRYNKQQILAAYLNSAYFGEHAYGIWAASERYFATTPRRLTLAQATLLAGLIQAPTAYNPFIRPAAARARQVDVLRSMVRNGFLTTSEASTVLDRPLPLRRGQPLAPIVGVDLAPGPAFTWWQLALGASVVIGGLTALIVLRSARFGSVHGLLAAKLASIVLVILGAAVAIRAFRSA